MKTKTRPSITNRSVQVLLLLTLLACFLLQDDASNVAFTARETHTSEYSMANTSNLGQDYRADDIKVLAEGFHSRIMKPFVGVFRDTETYAALVALDENLPKLGDDFFKENIAVAAFLGERNTGGYSVDIRANAIEILVLEKKPGKGMMVPQVITSPFKIVALKGATNYAARLNLFADDAWRSSISAYRVTNGKFRMTGGFAGISEEFGLQGPIGVMREGDLATFWLRIVGTGKRRLLMECATGLANRDGNVKISRMNADSLVDSPNSSLAGTATFSADRRKFSLILISRPSLVADGYSGQGTIEAEVQPLDFKP